jgi:hypothetical protein
MEEYEMRTIGNKICIALLAILVTAGMANTGSAQGQYGNNDTSLRDLIRRIQTRTTTFTNTAQNAVSRSNVSNISRNELNNLITDFENSVNQLNRRSYTRQGTQAEVRTVLERAALINNFLLNNRLGFGAQRDWDLVRGDLDQLAQVYNLNWQWNTGSAGGSAGSGYGDQNVNDTQIRQLVQRIDTRTVNFSRSFRQDLNRGTINDRHGLDEARRQLSEFESATAQLRTRVNSRQTNSSDVRNVLERAAFINSYVTDHQLGYQTKNNWDLLRQDLDSLASASNISWNWSTQPIPGSGGYSTDAQLTGTYRINTAQGDDARRVADDATRSLPTTDRQRIYDSLLRRLDPPQMLAIDRQGSNVTIASSRAPQINFVADDREHVETTQNGRTVRVRASLVGNQLSIARSGDRAQDFTVTFEPIDNGRRLLVTRRLYSDQFNQPAIVKTYYDKTSDVAQLNIYESSPEYGGGGTVGTTASGDFVIPSGTQLVAVLNTNLSTQTARDNDRFTMTVRSPSQYDGATIEGYVTNVNRAGKITGRSDVTLNFDTIRLRDGRTYRFAGILDSVRTPDGQNVRVDNEGAVREGDSQTTRTVQRAAIGTAVGAIIGAIAGGGKGAAIGAVIGAGAGAGSVYVQGRNDLELNTGTEVTIRATGPRN